MAKKARTESLPVIAFSSLPDNVAVVVPNNEALDFSFGDLTHDFVSTPVPGNDMVTRGFDSFFTDTPFNIVPVHETSDVSSDEENPTNKSLPVHIPTSPLSTDGLSSVASPECVLKTEDVNSSSKTDAGLTQKRQTDRAARNRESSRRAREKAKNRFRALENDNIVLREMVRRMRIQNESLITQVDRANDLQQSCTMCRYNTAMSQQPGGTAPALRG